MQLATGKDLLTGAKKIIKIQFETNQRNHLKSREKINWKTTHYQDDPKPGPPVRVSSDGLEALLREDHEGEGLALFAQVLA